MTNHVSQLRNQTDAEKAIFSRLFEANFSGRDELHQLTSHSLVRSIDRNGSLRLESTLLGHAPTTQQIPVEAECKDVDGYTIHVLFHVDKGRPYELEIYKDDSSNIKQMPSANELCLIVLPPAPED